LADIDSAPMAEMLLYGALPALIAAFSYPIGNQLVWQVSHNSRKHYPHKDKAKKQQVTEDKKLNSEQSHHEHSNQPLVSEAFDLSAVMSSTSDNNATLKTPSSIEVTPSSPLQNFIARIPAIETSLLQNAFNK